MVWNTFALTVWINFIETVIQERRNRQKESMTGVSQQFMCQFFVLQSSTILTSYLKNKIHKHSCDLIFILKVWTCTSEHMSPVEKITHNWQLILFFLFLLQVDTTSGQVETNTVTNKQNQMAVYFSTKQHRQKKHSDLAPDRQMETDGDRWRQQKLQPWNLTQTTTNTHSALWEVQDVVQCVWTES